MRDFPNRGVFVQATGSGGWPGIAPLSGRERSGARTGEREASSACVLARSRRQSFQPWLQAGAFDIVQPDVTKVGGISEERRIGWMAQENGVRFIPHGWNTAVGLAADLHLSSAFAFTDLVEYITGSPYVDELIVGGWRLDADGMLEIPSGPGLGIEVNLDTLARFAHP